MKPTQGHLDLIRDHWSLEGDIRFYRRVENFIYEARRGGKDVILRLTEPEHRSMPEIEAELDWVHYLAGAGLSVAAPIPSASGALIEECPFAGSSYFAALFTRAEGKALKEGSDFHRYRLERWGNYIGKMHRLTRDYRPKSELQPRSAWSEDASLRVARRGVDPRQDPVGAKAFQEVVEWLLDLEKDDRVYGLVHGDLHHGNFFVDRLGRMTAFDFDDCCYHWFAYDLVAPLFSLLSYSQDFSLGLDFENVMEPMLEGYLKEHEMGTQWIARLPGFFRYRVSLMQNWIRARVDDGIFDERGLKWCRLRLQWCEELLARPLALS